MYLNAWLISDEYLPLVHEIDESLIGKNKPVTKVSID